MGGSSKKVTVGYRYHLGLHFVLCHGTADNISRITVDKRPAWAGNNTGGRINISAPDLFGGESREGGVAGALDFLPGSATQAPNDYLQARLGADIPAFRGVVSAVLRQMYVGLNPYVKSWAFRVQRIFKRGDGSAQWYSDRAQIGNETIVDNSLWERVFVSSNLEGQYAIQRPIYAIALSGGVVSVQPVVSRGAGAINDDGSYVSPTDDSAHPRTVEAARFDVATGSYIGQGAASSIFCYRQIGQYFCCGKAASRLVWCQPGKRAQDGPILVLGNESTGLRDAAARIDHALPQNLYLHGVACDEGSGKILVFLGTDAVNNTTIWAELSSAGAVLRTGAFNYTGSVTEFGFGRAAEYHYASNFYSADLNLFITQYGAGDGAVRFYQFSGIDLVHVKTKNMNFYTFTTPTGIYENGAYTLLTGRSSFQQAQHYINKFETQVTVTEGQADMNPAHIIRECLTDRDWGMGYADSDIDDAAFAAAADALHAETFGISIVWDRQSTIEAFIEQILRHIDAALYVDRRTGKFVLKLIRNDYTVGTLLTLDESNIERVEGLGRPAFGELINSVSVAYWDAETGNDAAITLDDTALVQMQGGVINTTAQYPGITSRTLAARVAQRDLRTLSQPLLSCTIYATRAAAVLDIGDVFVLNWPSAGISATVMRVTGLALGDGRNNRVRITCTQDAFALPSQAVIAPPADEWVSPVEAPLAATHRAVQEAPYYELVQLIGQLDADTRLAANPDAGWLMVSAARPQDSAINAVVSVDAGAGFEQAAPLDFAPWAQLVADIGRADTAITVESGIDLAAITLGTHAQIGAELVRIDAIDLDTGAITIGRGVLDTVPQPHSAGDGVLFWDAYAVSDEVEYVAAESVSVKVQPATSAGLLAIDAAPTDVAVMDRRARRPYPPANLRIGGVLMPSTIGAAAGLGLIEWSHRDRTQQTSGTLADTTAGNIGPEAGTTYTLRIYDELDVMGFELTGITGTSHTYTESDELADMPQDDGLGGARLNTQLRIELFAVRDGLESWQKHNLVITRA